MPSRPGSAALSSVEPGETDAAVPADRRRGDGALRAARDFVWPPVRDGDHVQAAGERLLILFSLIFGMAGAVNTAVGLAIGLDLAVVIASLLVALFLLLVVPAYFHRSRNLVRSAWLLLLSYTAICGGAVAMTGGLLGAGSIFLLAAPVVGGLLLGLRAALAICGAVLALYLACYLGQDNVGMPVHRMQPDLMVDDMMQVLALLAVGLALVAGAFRRVIVGTNIRLRQARDRAEAANAALHRELAARRQLEAELHARAYADSLTGLPNRRHFFERAPAMLAAARAADDMFAIVALDIDRFKSINDRFGHSQGDIVLRAVADCAGGAVPGDGLLARIGGEEFVLALPGVDRAAAQAIAGRMRDAIAGVPVAAPAGGGALRLTASFGIAILAEGESLDRMLARADAAMYAAKRAGGDRIAAAPDGTDGQG